VVTDVRYEGADVAEDVGGLFVPHDVSDETSWANAVSAALDRFERLDILVNNAGIYWARSLSEATAEGFRRIFDVNLLGVFLGVRARSTRR
jgi:3alpha(or 20beta)-hydroxysteroid dehydrogenase